MNVSHSSLALEVNNQKAHGHARLMVSGPVALLVTRIVIDKGEDESRDEGWAPQRGGVEE